MRQTFPVTLCALALTAFASIFATAVRGETPSALAAAYAAQAAREQPGFAPAAERGRELFTRNFAVSKDFSNCATCHTNNPAAAGKHAVTGKGIAAMAPAVNSERFSSNAKTDKWFRRNCNEVIGRECSAAEKADFVTYMISVRR